MTMKQKEITVNSTLIHKGKIIDLYKENVRLPNGKETIREIVRHKGACAVLATTENDEIILIQQYRKSLDKVIYEVPAGGIESGEDLAVCAMRELEEETAYRPKDDSVIYLAGLCTTPGFSDEMIHIFYAKNVVKTSEKRDCDEDEFIEVLLLSEAEVLEWISTGKIIDAKTVCAFFLYQQYKTDNLVQG